ncbi:MAG: alkaline phosphatase family protein [Acidobacteriota bacterium]
MRHAAAAGLAGGIALGLLALAGCGEAAPPVPAADPGMRVLLIGVDGASWEQMMPLLRAGEMPRLEAVMRDGFAARLTTMEPALSPVIWTTIATGKSPRKHGIHGFLAPDPAAGKRLPVTSNLRRTSAIWNMLGSAGVPVGVVGWWVTWPAEPVNGWMVSPYSAPGQTTWKGTVYTDGRADQTWPRDYGKEIRAEIETGVNGAADEFHRLFPIPEGTELPDYLKAFVADTRWVHISDRIFREVGVKMLRDQGPRFTAVYFGGVDVTGHRFWRFAHPDEGHWERTPEQIRIFSGALDEYYRWTDAAIGRLVDAAPPGTTVLIVSDHGMELRRGQKDRPPTPQNLYPEEISGGHSKGPDGILIAAGPGIARNFFAGFWPEGSAMPRLGSRSHPAVVDLAPTLLALFGLPAGADMDGGVLQPVLDDPPSPPDPARIPTWDALTPARPEAIPMESPRMDEVLKRLEGLGYIDGD